MKFYFVYILKCSDNSFYTGMTNDLERRFYEHMTSTNNYDYAFSRKPIKLVWSENFLSPNEAILREKQIKGWSRNKKIALINSDWNDLESLSKNSILKRKSLRQAQTDKQLSP